MKPTFKKQYDKIVGAYLRNELKPYDNCACFIGNMLNNDHTWGWRRGLIVRPDDKSRSMWSVLPEYTDSKETVYQFYSIQEIVDMENLFLDTYSDGINTTSEQTLFSAMESTLLLLRQIHESKGEVVEDYIFEKRALIEA